MSERKRFLLLIFIMATASVIVAGVTITMLYRTAFNEQQARLVETAQSQARLIEAVARFDKAHESRHPRSFPEGSTKATLSQIIDAHEHYTGFGETGEFTLSKNEGDKIVFLLSHRHYDLDKPKPVSIKSKLAEPMRLALSGQSGTVVGLDYRGETVLAAHEPVGELNLGIVAKIDLKEIRSPFVKAGMTAGLFTLIVVLIGTSLFIQISNPIIKKLEYRAIEFEKLNVEMKQEIEDRKRAKDALRQAHDELERRVAERTSELRNLSSKLLVAHEEERKRIGRDLHDGLAQTLSAIKFGIENALSQMNQGNLSEVKKSLDSLVTISQETVEEVRRVSRNLRPSILDDLGLLPTISWICQEIGTLYSGLNIEKQIEIEENDIPDSLKIIIFRVLQEALSNTAKHSQANLVCLSLKRTNRSIELTIDDDGIGFDFEKVISEKDTKKGLGLVSMRERTELSDGWFSVKSQRGAGTTVQALWQCL